jgi:hypothetical protein
MRLPANHYEFAENALQVSWLGTLQVNYTNLIYSADEVVKSAYLFEARNCYKAEDYSCHVFNRQTHVKPAILVRKEQRSAG